MKKIILKNREATLTLVAKELASSEIATYHHRLHALLLVANGLTCKEVGELFGEDTRTIQRWIKRYEERGLDGLRNEKRFGAKPTLTPRQMKEIREYLVATPAKPRRGTRRSPWTGAQLSEHLKENYDLVIGVRNCQRLLGQMNLPMRVFDRRSAPTTTFK